MLLMSPSMPSGACFDVDDWTSICELCVANDLLLILDTAMERLVYDNGKVSHPAGLPGMEERTITVGSSAKELRMIGWRVGWIVAPERFIPDVTAVSLANGTERSASWCAGRWMVASHASVRLRGSESVFDPHCDARPRQVIPWQ
jgi:aspartate/methionine/tyrosine aminotransferase